MTEEINNGNIQPPDNVSGTISDSADLHSEGNRTDKQRLDSADLGASKPVPVAKPEPKRTLEHAVVKACGHRIDLRHPPTQANCEDCWTAFFTLAVDTPTLHKILVEQGRSGMERMLGKKFVKHFGKFLQSQLRVPVEAAKVESAIEGSILNINAEREAQIGIR